MKEEVIESIFGCLERIEEKLDKQPVQTEQGEREDSKLTQVLEAIAASQEQGHKRLEALWTALKIISDRQKESKKELVACSTAIALEWDAAFRGMNDPSGRAVKGVHLFLSYRFMYSVGNAPMIF